MEWIVAIGILGILLIVILNKGSSGAGTRHPIVHSGHFQPETAMITLTDAKKFYRQYLREFTEQDREEIAEAVRMFAADVAEAIEDMKADAQNAEQDAREARERIAELEHKLAASPGDEDLVDALEEARDELASALKENSEALAEAKALRLDKRQYLIDYINREFHGPDWRDRLDVPP